MSQILVLAGDTIVARSILMTLQMEGFEPKRVSNGDDLLSQFSKGEAAGVLCDVAAPWGALVTLMRRVRAHGLGKRYRLMLFGEARDKLPQAGLDALAISSEDIFYDPVDMPRMVKRLRELPAPATQARAGGAGALSREGVPAAGRLEFGVVARLLAALMRSSATGQLEVDGARHGLMTLTLKEGDPVSVTVPTGRLSLGELMVTRGRMDRSQLMEISKHGAVTLEALVNQGVLGPHESLSIGKEQGQEAIAAALSEAEGSFRWHSGRLPSGSLFSLGINVARIILDSFKERGPAELSPELALLTPGLDEDGRAQLERWGLVPFELRVVNQLNGSRSLELIVDTLASGSLVKRKEIIGLLTGLSMLGVVGDASPFEGVQEEEPETWEMRKTRFEEELKRMQDADPYTVLGLAPQTSIGEVRAKFFTLSKQYHPDRAFDAPPEVRALMEELFRKVGEAYEVASDPKKREEYKKNKEAEGLGGLDPRDAIRAEIAFSQGELHLKNNNFDKARGFFEDALKLNPHAVEYKAYLGWCLFLIDHERFAEAARLIHEALKVSPNLDRAYYFMGAIFKSRNEMSQAENAFKKAVSINANNIEAQRELRLLQMRRGQTGGDKASSDKSGSDKSGNDKAGSARGGTEKKRSFFDLFRRS